MHATLACVGIQLSNHKKIQLRRGISQNNTKVLQSATILYWYFFSNHNRHALPLLLISICNIGNNIPILVFTTSKCFKELKFIEDPCHHFTRENMRTINWQESQWKPLFVGFSFVFLSLFYIILGMCIMCMLPYILYSNDVCKTFKWHICSVKSRLW